MWEEENERRQEHERVGGREKGRKNDSERERKV